MKSMRVVVTGDRDWKNWRFINESLDEFHRITPISVLINGKARGADSHCRNWAISRGVEYLDFPAQWHRFRHAAGPIRNQQMIDEGYPEFGIAFHNDIANSKGTKDMIERLEKHKIPYVLLKEGDSEESLC